jgi:hypothetical protein
VTIDTDGLVESVLVEDRVSVFEALALLPAASRAVRVMTFVPVASGIPATLQFVVPVATPLPPRSLDHVTCVTPTLSDAEPLKSIDEDVVVLVVGDAIDTVGRVVSPPPVVIDQLKVCEVVRTPSDARAVTEYVPAVVPVPETNPVLA